MCQCVKLLMILQSDRLFFNSYIMRAAIKDGKILINKWQINTNGITYTQKSSFIYSHMRIVSAVTLLDQKKHYIQPRQQIYNRKYVLIQFICPFMKVTNFQLLHNVTYQVRLKQNHCVLFFFRQLLIFCRKILFVNIGALEN